MRGMRTRMKEVWRCATLVVVKGLLRCISRRDRVLPSRRMWQTDEWTFSLPEPRDAGFPSSGLKSVSWWPGVSLFGSGTSPGRYRGANVISSLSCLSCRIPSHAVDVVVSSEGILEVHTSCRCEEDGVIGLTTLESCLLVFSSPDRGFLDSGTSNKTVYPIDVSLQLRVCPQS